MTTPAATAAGSASCQGCGFAFGAEDLIHCERSAGGAGGSDDLPVWSEAWLCPACYAHEKNAARARHREPPHPVADEGEGRAPL